MESDAPPSRPQPDEAKIAELKQKIDEKKEQLARKQNEFDETVPDIIIDGLALNKLIKHCRQTPPEERDSLQGLLLGGTATRELIEITDTFALPSSGEEVEEREERKYQTEMLRCLDKANGDSTTVGWYQSSPTDFFFNDYNVLSMYINWSSQYQRCVVIVYDPVKSQGGLFLQASTLSSAFLKLARQHPNATLEKIPISNQEILVNIPIKVRNPMLPSQFLKDHGLNFAQRQLNFESLSLSPSTSMAKSFDALLNYAEQYEQKVQKKMIDYQRNQRHQKPRRGEDGEEEPDHTPKQPPPPRLDSAILHYQIDDHCKQISQFSSQGLTKLSVLNKLFE